MAANHEVWYDAVELAVLVPEATRARAQLLEVRDGLWHLLVEEADRDLCDAGRGWRQLGVATA